MLYIGHLAKVSPNFRERHRFIVLTLDSRGQIFLGASLAPELMFVGPAALVMLDSTNIHAANRLSVRLRARKSERQTVVIRVIPAVQFDSPFARVLNGKGPKSAEWSLVGIVDELQITDDPFIGQCK